MIAMSVMVGSKCDCYVSFERVHMNAIAQQKFLRFFVLLEKVRNLVVILTNIAKKGQKNL